MAARTAQQRAAQRRTGGAGTGRDERQADDGRVLQQAADGRRTTGGERAPRQADPRWAAAKKTSRDPREPWTHDGGRPAAGGTMDLGGMR